MVFSTLCLQILSSLRSLFGAVGKQDKLASHAQSFPLTLIIFPHNTRVRFPESLLKRFEAMMETKTAATVSQGPRQECEIKDLSSFPCPGPF